MFKIITLLNTPTVYAEPVKAAGTVDNFLYVRKPEIITTLANGNVKIVNPYYQRYNKIFRNNGYTIGQYAELFPVNA